MAIFTVTAVTTTSRIGAFAQLASGGGWKTSITLVNLSSVRVTARINFYADNGTPLTLPLSVIQTGTNSTNSTVDATIEPNGTFVVESDAAASLVVGWADVQASGPLTGYAVFRFRTPGAPDSEGAVPLDSRASSSMVIPYDNMTGFQSGLALVNQSSAVTSVSVTVRDTDGLLVGVAQIPLPSLGHAAFFVSDFIPLARNRRGILEIQNPAGNVTGIGLRFNPFGTFVSLPIIR